MFSDAQTAKERLKAAGFVEVETSLEEAPTRFETAQQYSEFVSKVILHRHLEQLPEVRLRQALLDRLVDQASADHLPFELDYWRLNLSAEKPASG